MLAVFDAFAFAAIDDEAREPFRIFDALTRQVESSELTYCDEVVDELDRIAADSYAARWARSLKRSRCDVGAGYEYYQRVLDDAPDLLDEDVAGESAPIQVLAQAVWLQDIGQEVVVVTDDVVDKPTRCALASACRRFGIEWMLPRPYLARCGIEELLA